MGDVASRLTNKKIGNLKEYLYLKEVRARTGLLNGKIIYDGLEWTEEEYNRRFPKPKLIYITDNPDKKHIPK